MNDTEAEALRQRMIQTGERQYATDINAIKKNHSQRYRWAADQLEGDERVLDAGCGTGYGSSILAGKAEHVTGIDVSEESVELANHFWGKNDPHMSFEVHELHSIDGLEPGFTAAVCFEVIEHLVMPTLFLTQLWLKVRPDAPCFFSVPNINVEPHRLDSNPFHLKHYQPQEFVELLELCGFSGVELYDQTGPVNNPDPIHPHKPPVGGKIILATARRSPVAGPLLQDIKAMRHHLPTHFHRAFIDRCRTIRNLRQS